jgi:hypothetical protein
LLSPQDQDLWSTQRTIAIFCRTRESLVHAHCSRGPQRLDLEP